MKNSRGFFKKVSPQPPSLGFFGNRPMDKIKMDRIQTKIKWKIHAFYTLYFKFQRYFFWKCVRCNHQIFYFLLFLLVLTSGGTIFCKFLELHSTMSDKKIFVINLSLLTDPLKLPSPPPPPHHPLNDQNLLSMTKVFCQCSLKQKAIFHVSNLKGLLNEL